MKTTYDLKTSVIAFEWSADEQEKMTDEVKQDALDLVKFVAEGLKDVIHPMQSLHSSKNKSGIYYMIESRDTNASYANCVVPGNYLAIKRLTKESMGSETPIKTVHEAMWVANREAGFRFWGEEDAERAAKVLVPEIDVVITEHVDS